MSVSVEVVASSPGLERVRGPVGDLVRATLAAEQVFSGSVTVAFVDEREMTDLNRRFRQLEEPTDVLSFRQADCRGEWPDPSENGRTDLGDVAVCRSVVQRYALEEGGDPDTQLGWSILHGVLHLVGYDHEQDDGQMRTRERDLLAELAPQVKAVSGAIGK